MNDDDYARNKRKAKALINKIEFSLAYQIHAPVASIAALVKVLTDEKCTEADRLKSVEFLNEATKKLDADTRESMRDLVELKKCLEIKD